jgi:hypothetical protein
MNHAGYRQYRSAQAPQGAPGMRLNCDQRASKAGDTDARGMANEEGFAPSASHLFRALDRARSTEAPSHRLDHRQNRFICGIAADILLVSHSSSDLASGLSSRSRFDAAEFACELAMAYDPAKGSEITIFSRRLGSELHPELHWRT